MAREPDSPCLKPLRADTFFRITDCDGDESEDGHEESKQYDEMLKMIEDADRWTISADDFVDEDNKTEEKSDT